MPNGTHGTKRAKAKATLKNTETKPYKHLNRKAPAMEILGKLSGDTQILHCQLTEEMCCQINLFRSKSRIELGSSDPR